MIEGDRNTVCRVGKGGSAPPLLLLRREGIFILSVLWLSK